MITVHIWKPSDIIGVRDYAESLENSETVSGFKNSVGHIAVSVVRYGTTVAYLSFWPEDIDEVKEEAECAEGSDPYYNPFNSTCIYDREAGFLEGITELPGKLRHELQTLGTSMRGTAGEFHDDLLIDIRIMEGSPNLELDINWLNEDVMLEKIYELKEGNPQYHLLKRNCSTLAYEVLSLGANNASFGILDKFKTFMSRYMRAAKAASLATAFVKKDLSYFFGSASLSSAVYSLAEMIGVCTPISVSEYAEKLEEIDED